MTPDPADVPMTSSGASSRRQSRRTYAGCWHTTSALARPASSADPAAGAVSAPTPPRGRPYPGRHTYSQLETRNSKPTGSN